MTNWTWIGQDGVGNWTDPYWLDDDVPGDDTYGTPAAGDTVFFEGSFGLTINAQALTNIMNVVSATSVGVIIQSSTFELGNTLNVEIGQTSGNSFGADIYGGLENDGIINIGTAGTTGHADFQFSQSGTFTTSPVLLNTGSINVVQGEFQLEDGGATGAIDGQFNNQGDIN